MERIVDRLAKWKMHRFYAKHPEISKSLPPAELLSPAALDRFFTLYGTVYIKGNTMHTGKGIVKAWKTASGYRYVRVRGTIKRVSTVHELVRRVREEISATEVFIVQRGIDLAVIDGRPFDIRVMMMRDGTRKWHYAGMVAKVHGPGSVVSNVRRGGGYVTNVENALTKSNFSKLQIRNIKKQLIALSRAIIDYSEQYPFFSYQSGIDLAVDKQGRVWIIEVNLHNPSHGLFRQLEDKKYYRRITALYRNYRRHNKRVI